MGDKGVVAYKRHKRHNQRENVGKTLNQSDCRSQTTRAMPVGGFARGIGRNNITGGAVQYIGGL